MTLFRSHDTDTQDNPRTCYEQFRWNNFLSLSLAGWSVHLLLDERLAYFVKQDN